MANILTSGKVLIFLIAANESFSEGQKRLQIIQDRTNYIPPYARDGDYGDPYACNGLNWTHKGYSDYNCSMFVLDSILSWGAPGGDSTTCDVVFYILDKDKPVIIGCADGRIVDFRTNISAYFLCDSVFTISTRVLEKCGNDSIQYRYERRKSLGITAPTNSNAGNKK